MRITSAAWPCHIPGGMDTDAETPPSPNLLLVEDDQDLRAEMAAYLSANGYRVLEAGDVTEARRRLSEGAVHLMVLDVNLPGEDGLSFCRKLNDERGPPILMLSAMGETVDRILGLELGADDYVVKPVTPRELLARVKALLRRRPPAANANEAMGYSFAGFKLDLAARQLRAPNGMILLLTRGELAILTALLARPRMVVTREELLAAVRGESVDEIGRGVDLHISRLRRKIQDQTTQEVIRTQRGIGYMLDARVTPE